MRKTIFLSARAVVCATGIAASLFVTYRHYVALRRLPKLELAPRQLSLPLSLRESALPGMRWIEVEASAAPGLAGRPARYRDTVESPQSLILEFNPGFEPDSSRRRYRGVLYTAIYRSATAAPDPLIHELLSAGIRPQPRFAVLRVNESPWRILKAIVKEVGAFASALLIAVFLALRAVAPAARRGRPTWMRAVVGSAALATIAWAVYASSVHGRPVLPIGTILGLGLCAALSLYQPAEVKGEKPCHAEV